MRDNAFILICSFRYSCGRHSVAPSIVADYIVEHKHLLTNNSIEQMRKEVYDRKLQGTLGDKCDEEVWFNMLNKLIKLEETK